MSRIASLQEQLQRVDGLIAQLESDVTKQPKPSTLANIRALEKGRKTLQRDFDRAASQAKVDVCRYRVLNTEPATMDGLTDVWRRFETLLTTVYQSLQGTLPAVVIEKPKGRRKSKAEPTAAPPPPQLRLGFGYTFAGSVGLALTLPKQPGLFSDEIIIQAADTIFELAKAYGDTEKVHQLVRKLGPAPTEAMYCWVDSHIAHRYGAGIDWQRNGEIKAGMFLQYEELNALRTELSKTKIEDRIEVTGTLIAVDTRARSFVVDADIGEVYEGSYEDAITAEHVARVPSRYKATITVSKKVIPDEGKEDQVEYFLLSLHDVE